VCPNSLLRLALYKLLTYLLTTVILIFTPAGFFVTASIRFVFEGVESVPVMSSLQSSQSAGRHLDNLLTSARRLDVRRLHRAVDAGLEADEYAEVLESLQTVASCYKTETVDMLWSSIFSVCFYFCLLLVRLFLPGVSPVKFKKTTVKSMWNVGLYNYTVYCICDFTVSPCLPSLLVFATRGSDFKLVQHYCRYDILQYFLYWKNYRVME